MVTQASVNNPWRELAACAAALTNGGQSFVEALTVGLPTVSIAEDDTQLSFVKACEKSLNCIGLEARVPSIWTPVVADFAASIWTRKTITDAARKGRTPFDGRGADLVAETLSDAWLR